MNDLTLLTIPFDGDEDDLCCSECNGLGLVPNYETGYDETCEFCNGTGTVFTFGITLKDEDSDPPPLNF